MTDTSKKIALNPQRKPHKGRISEQLLESYDQLTAEGWLGQMVDAIRGGNEALKSELPFRAAHYYRFKEGHRTQKAADPEAFLFQTTIDVDDPALVEPAIQKAMALDAEPTSPWCGQLLHAEYSARRKVHFDVRMPVGQTIAETQRAYCEALGIPEAFDEACVSPERIIYITDERQEIYRSDAWYAILPPEELAQRREAYARRGLTIDGRPTAANGWNGGGRPMTNGFNGGNANGSAANGGSANGSAANGGAGGNVQLELFADNAQPEEPTAKALSAFELCTRNAGLDPERLDIWGEHNWHTNLMSVLSVGLPKLMSKEQLYAVVYKKLPNYSQTDDCRKLIDYFYSTYAAGQGYMSAALRDINAQAEKVELEADQPADDDQIYLNAYEKMLEGWDAPKLPRRLVRLLELLVGNYDPRFREMLLMAALPVLSAHASHFRARYLNGRIIGPQQFVGIIGGSGSGKGTCTALFQEMVEQTLQANDKAEWEKVKRNSDLRDKKANAKERPSKYHPKLRLFETTSKSSILELQTNLGRNGMLLGQFSEVDGLSASARAAYSDLGVLLRKAWDMDWQRQFYLSDATCNTYVQMSISLLMAGTPKAMLERMFTDNNCEGGLMQRFIPVLVPKAKRSFRPPVQNVLTEEEKKERDMLLISLYQKDLALGEETCLLETPMMNRAIGAWFDELEVRYNDGQLTDAEADLSHRCGEFMLRAAIPLIALNGGESKEIVEFCRWVGESAHYTMCRIFGQRVQQSIAESNELICRKADQRCTIEPLLDRLPDVFTVEQLKQERERSGQSTDVRMLLSRYSRIGKIEKLSRGVYRKRTAQPRATLKAQPGEAQAALQGQPSEALQTQPSEAPGESK